jgi:hypothetical protein
MKRRGEKQSQFWEKWLENWFHVNETPQVPVELRYTVLVSMSVAAIRPKANTSVQGTKTTLCEEVQHVPETWFPCLAIYCPSIGSALAVSPRLKAWFQLKFIRVFDNSWGKLQATANKINATEPILRSHQPLSDSRIFQHFMEPEN